MEPPSPRSLMVTRVHTWRSLYLSSTASCSWSGMSLTTTFFMEPQADIATTVANRSTTSFFNPITSTRDISNSRIERTRAVRGSIRGSTHAGVVLDPHALPGGLDVDGHHVDAGRKLES